MDARIRRLGGGYHHLLIDGPLTILEDGASVAPEVAFS